MMPSAVEVGFEPTKGLLPHTLSKRAPSATRRPPLRPERWKLFATALFSLPMSSLATPVVRSRSVTRRALPTLGGAVGTPPGIRRPSRHPWPQSALAPLSPRHDPSLSLTSSAKASHWEADPGSTAEKLVTRCITRPVSVPAATIPAWQVRLGRAAVARRWAGRGLSGPAALR
jgi:hypothetical protein